MFEIYVKKNGSIPPDSVPHYIVAGDGIFLKKKNWWMDAVVPVKRISFLEEQKPELKVTLPPISSRVIYKAWRFFQKVYQKHRSESAVLLHYSQTEGWELTVPVQQVEFAHVGYEMTDRITDYVLIGTMHSHSSMAAFHSGTDTHDEGEFDGVHITFGNLDRKTKFSLDAEVVINGTRFPLPIESLEGVNKVESKKKGTSVENAEVVLPSDTHAFARPVSYFTSTCPPELELWEVPDEWMEKVTKMKITDHYVPSFTNPMFPVRQSPEEYFSGPFFTGDDNPRDGIEKPDPSKKVMVKRERKGAK